MNSTYEGRGTRRFDHQEARRLYEIEGLSCAQIARRFYVADSAVWRALIRMGVTIRPNKHNTNREEVFSLFESGVSQSEIARRFGVSRQAIFQIIRGRV